MDLDQALSLHFGFNQFRDGQREVIANLLAGRSAAAVFPTGGGKSLCYQLPAMLLPGVTLVVSPLIALMKDQIDALAERGIAARRLDSTLDADEYRQVMQAVRDGDIRMLFVAPERFNNERFRAALRRIPISLFAVDEAHCISEWGHNFRPDYLKLAGFARDFDAERVLALTATATPRVLDEICDRVSIAPEHAVRTGFYRPNLTLLLTPVDAEQRDAELLQSLRDSSPGPTVVYVTRQKTAEVVAEQLAEAGFDARAYHAGLSAERRAEVQDWFLPSREGVVVATIAFGMGIDKPDIRYVYHYNLPKSLESYSQEIGRAGRDGEQARCRMLACAQDRLVLENFIYGDTPTKDAVAGLIDALFDESEPDDLAIGLFDLSRRLDVRDLVLRTLITYLELDGYLEGGTPTYSVFRFIPKQSSREIAAHFDEDTAGFLMDIFRCAQKASKWFTVDVEEAQARTGAPRERVVAALEHLSERQLIELKTERVTHRYRRLRQPNDRPALANELFQRLEAREAAELHRVQQVLDLVQLDTCQVAALAAHFGEEIDACGHCTVCLQGPQDMADMASSPTPDPSVIAAATAAAQEHDILRAPIPMARFLCGLTSPHLTQARLTRHPLFATMEDIPFVQVRAATTQALQPDP